VADLEIPSIDVKTAFLYSQLKETIYLKRLPGLSSSIMPPIVKLNKYMDLNKQLMNGGNFLDLSIEDLSFHQFKTDA
jgi:hypothetical protein